MGSKLYLTFFLISLPFALPLYAADGCDRIAVFDFENDLIAKDRVIESVLDEQENAMFAIVDFGSGRIPVVIRGTNKQTTALNAADMRLASSVHKLLRIADQPGTKYKTLVHNYINLLRLRLFYLPSTMAAAAATGSFTFALSGPWKTMAATAFVMANFIAAARGISQAWNTTDQMLANAPAIGSKSHRPVNNLREILRGNAKQLLYAEINLGKSDVLDRNNSTAWLRSQGAKDLAFISSQQLQQELAFFKPVEADLVISRLRGDSFRPIDKDVIAATRIRSVAVDLQKPGHISQLLGFCKSNPNFNFASLMQDAASNFSLLFLDTTKGYSLALGVSYRDRSNNLNVVFSNRRRRDTYTELTRIALDPVFASEITAADVEGIYKRVLRTHEEFSNDSTLFGVAELAEFLKYHQDSLANEPSSLARSLEQAVSSSMMEAIAP